MIDFHAHIFPDGIALQTVQKLAAAAGIEYHTDGTAQALCGAMKEAGVAYAVNLPVATKPEQVRGINRWIIELGRKYPSLVSFGAMHPLFENFRDEVAFLAENGIKGVKLHPEYQDFFPDDDRCAALYEACREYGIIVHFHAGADLAYADCHGRPARFVPVLGIAGLKVVLAHMGGFRMWDDFETHLAGKQVYLDTSVSYEMGREQMRRLILAHGPEKVLFGTDSPWDYAARMEQFIHSLDLGVEAERKIFSDNASTLLCL